jgi:superfamily II RNA helicase
VSTPAPARPFLLARVPAAGGADASLVLDRFLGFVADSGVVAYPAQEEALLELYAGKHVILATPTGSGKSLVALGLHFKAFCEGRRSFYTCPIKALVSEKFFALCDDLGPGNVGMLTGDASINRDAPIVCCTAEVLANMALRHGAALDAPYVVMDEFHYYADRDRGMAWQVPLLALPHTTFLLMSATLGNTAPLEERIAARTGRPVAHVSSDLRPVPLEFEYAETPLHETVERLVSAGRAPIYVVSFTQRECAERAQALTSAKVADREEKRRVADAIAGFRFDSSYGKDVQRFLRHGVGIHHAGLLPKYRLLVEQLAQQGLLQVICGTDTLGVGINVPIRTVLFTQLCKWDGEKTAILTVRDFRQIAGRAGRKGFDERGYVVAQAPEHVIENQRADAKAAAAGKKAPPKRKPPSQGFVPWSRETFERLATRPAEPLQSRFEVSHGALLQVLQRETEDGGAPGSGYRALLELIDVCHEDARAKARHRRRAAALFRALRRAGIVSLVRRSSPDGRTRTGVALDPGLQRNFSLHHTLSLYLVEVVGALDPAHPDYVLDVLSCVEAILENPRPILLAQERREKDRVIAELKAAGVPYEERLRELEAVTWPKPKADFLYATFHAFSEHHPWASEELVRPKSIARELVEGYRGFHDFVKELGIARSEGLLLRYLGDVYTALARTVPEERRTETLEDVLAFLRLLLERVDASLVEEWERLRDPAFATVAAARLGAGEEPPAPAPFDLAAHPRALAARVRAELHRLVQALARRDYEEAALCVRRDAEEPWDAARFEAALAPFFAEHAELVFTPAARQAHWTRIRPLEPGRARRFEVSQTLLDPGGENFWSLEGELDLPPGSAPEGPLIALRRIGT